jgi:hypothetical protein
LGFKADPSGGSAFSGARASSTAPEGQASGSIGVVSFTGEAYDTDAWHDPSSSFGQKMTVPSGKDGVIDLRAQIAFEANATGSRQVRIRKNGSTDISQVTVKPADIPTFAQIFARDGVAVAGDYYEVYVYQDSGSSLTTQVGCYFEAAKIG